MRRVRSDGRRAGSVVSSQECRGGGRPPAVASLSRFFDRMVESGGDDSAEEESGTADIESILVYSPARVRRHGSCTGTTAAATSLSSPSPTANSMTIIWWCSPALTRAGRRTDCGFIICRTPYTTAGKPHEPGRGQGVSWMTSCKHAIQNPECPWGCGLQPGPGTRH